MRSQLVNSRLRGKNMSAPRLLPVKSLPGVRRGTLAAGALALVAFTAACGSGAPSAATGVSSPVVYAVATAFTGSSAVNGALFSPAMQIACHEINSAGGILGHRCEVQNYNTLGDSADAVLAVRKALSDRDVRAVFGLGTGVGPTTVPIIAAAHSVAFSFSGDSFFWHNAQIAPYEYMTQPPDAQSGVAMAVAAKELGLSRPAVVFQGGPDSAPIAAGVTAGLKNLGITPAISTDITSGLVSYGSVARAVAAARPDGLITEIDDPPSAATFFSNLKTALGGSYNLKTVTDNVSTASQFVSAVGHAIGASTFPKYFYVVQAIAAGNTPGAHIVSSLWKTYQPAQPITASFTFPFYDTGILTALAMTEVGSVTDAAKWRPIISQIADGTPGSVNVYTYAEGVKALKEGKKIHYVGAAGNMGWDSFHSRTVPQGAYREQANGGLPASPAVVASTQVILANTKGIPSNVQ